MISFRISSEIVKNCAKIPNFSIENGQLTTNGQGEGFIYQTDSIIFTFDPEGKRNATDIASDATANVLSVGLLKKKLLSVSLEQDFPHHS
ncbi:DUF1189 domain-containing protein [Enterococcus gallinarum]|nr:DUF1189 domain-containing protein [Enterococcus gallinarum]